MDDRNQGNDPNKGKPQQINIELSEAIAEGVYSNLAIISHSNAEFVIDFTRILPGVPKAKVQSRIIMTPQHAKMLYRALAENIAKFEHQNGEIRIDQGGPNDISSFFGGSPMTN